jgi:hypothetical protein
MVDTDEQEQIADAEVVDDEDDDDEEPVDGEDEAIMAGGADLLAAGVNPELV